VSGFKTVPDSLTESTAFSLGIGFPFQAPVASASIPEIVGKEQLPSAIALGGIQMNLAGIIGPAIGGFLVPLVGVSSVFAMNALAFVLVLFAVTTWKRKSEVLDTPLESFFDSLAGAVGLAHSLKARLMRGQA
jgi:MFS family permease